MKYLYIHKDFLKIKKSLTFECILLTIINLKSISIKDS